MNRQIFPLIICWLIAACASTHENAILMTQKEATEHLEKYEKNVKEKPQDIKARFKLAQAHVATEAYEQALAELNRIIAADPNFANAYLLKARIHEFRTEPAARLKTFLQILALPHGHNYAERIARQVGMPHPISALNVGAGNNIMPRYSPDGQKIAWQSDRDGDWNIYMADIDGGSAQTIVFGKGDDENPVFSPDGHFLAFVAQRNEKKQHDLGNEKREIYLYDLNFRKEMRLTSNDYDDWAPAFYPDSSSLVFVSERGESALEKFIERKSRLLLMQVGADTARSFREGEGEKDRTSPAPLHDGRLAWVEIEHGEYRILAGDGNSIPDTLISDAAPKSGLCASSDGKFLAFFIKQDDNVDIYLLNLYNEGLQRITASQSKDIYASFSPDGSTLIFSSDRFGKFGLFTMDLTSPISLDELRNRLESLHKNIKGVQSTE